MSSDEEQFSVSGGYSIPPKPAISRSSTIRIGLLLTLVAVLLGTVRFARYDWTPLPLDRGPISSTRQVGPDCLEQIRPYTTESGRVVQPIVVDEQQYMSLVEYYRGTPREDLQAVCLYDPFTNRSGMSWIAHWLPFDEAVAISVTNVAMFLIAMWLVLLTLRRQGFAPRVVFAAATLFTVGWNTFYFSSGLLVETGVVAGIALCWYLLCTRRVWWIWPILLVGYPIKETIGIMIPVLWVWAWNEYRTQRRSLVSAAAPALAATVAFVVGVAFWRHQLPQPDAAWEVTPDLADTLANLFDVISLASFAVGVLPLLIPSVLRYRSQARRIGWWPALLDPAVVGVAVTAAICGWSFITVDLTPRLFWMGFPFATSLAAAWLSSPRPARWLDSQPIPESLIRADEDVPSST